MLRIPCPKCGKALYTSDVESFYPCLYCGFVFSGKYGPERRHERRTQKEIPFLLSYKGRNFEASALDFSKRGVGIKILGKAPIAKEDVLTFPIADSSINAKVMWVKKLPYESLAGLQRIN
jgi:hypothetical protein